MSKKINDGLILDEDNIVKLGDNGLIEVTQENLKELADQLQFDTLAQECIVEDLCRSYNISREDMFVLIHELKKRGNNVVTMNTSASYDENSEEKTTVTLIRNYGHEQLINDLSYEIENNYTKVRYLYEFIEFYRGTKNY